MTATAQQRAPLHDVDAEKIVLGVMMLGTRADIDGIAAILSSSDYYEGKHGTIHEAIAELHKRSEPTGPVAVAAELLKTGALEKVGGVPFLHECTEAVPSAAQGPWYARQVADHAQRRRQLAELYALARKIKTPGVDTSAAIAEALAGIVGVTISEAPALGARGQRAVPGSPGWTYTPGEGLWREGKRVLSWCPTVTAHLMVFTTRGGISSRKVSLAVGEFTATVPLSEVADGTVWTDRFPAAVGVAERQVRDVLRNVIDAQAAMLPNLPMYPRWEAGRLELPPVDVLPRGLGEIAGTREDFRAMLREVARSPRVALAMGLTVAGLYVGVLGRESYVLHFSGASSVGKTTTMLVCSSIFGAARDGLVKPWNVSEKGVAAHLRSLAVLPGFRDELHASNLTGDKLESVIFAICEGAMRDVSDRAGNHKDAASGWRGVLVSSGNKGMLSQISNEGIAARVIELSTPLTSTAETAETLEDMVKACYGHGFAAITERAMTPSEFAEEIRKASVDLGVPGGGPTRRLGKHIAGGIAGARLLADLFDVPELAGALVETARTELLILAEGLTERGESPGLRLLAAVAEAVVARPADFPTPSEYTAAAEGAGRPGAMGRDVAGFDISASRAPGDIAVIPGKLIAIANAAGIADHMIALKELRTSGHLIPQGTELQRKVPVGKWKPRAYVFTNVENDAAGEVPGDSGKVPSEVPSEVPGTPGTNPSALTCENV